MVSSFSDNLCRVIILDISGLYAQIYDQGYFSKDEAQKMFELYNDKTHWCCLTL